MNRIVVRHTSGWAGRAAWLAVLVVLVGLTGVAGRAQQGQGQSRHLFEARGEAADAAPGQLDRTKKRGRRVHVNGAALQEADAPGGNDIVTLNLFDDVQLRARRSRLDVTRSGGTVWHGRLLDVAGDATFAMQGGVVSGTVFAGDKVFEVLYAGDGEHEVREIEPSEFGTDDPPADLAPVEPDPQAEAMDAAVAAGMAGDAASQIDVMVVWTPASRTAAGGTSAIQSLVDLAVANANTAYANSGVTQRLRLVYSGEVSYTEGSGNTDLSRLSSPSDGYLDTVHTLRNTYGADVVTLLGEGYACGVGYLMTYVSTGFASSAFNVVDRTCAAGNLTYAHELGHNMGLQHDPANASSNPAYTYAYGYQHPAGAFRTVMAYPCPTGGCPRLMYFANPSVSYSGMPTGTASQNTAAALNNTASSVANFRQAVSGSCSYSLSSTSTSVGSGTATASVGVTAGSGCAWNASSNASWLSITSGTPGNGGGNAGFSVAANPAGTPRAGTLTVAGLTYTVNQAAAACGAFSISPTGQSNVGASGASLSVTVTGTTGCARTATSNASWITVTAGASGTGGGTVSLNVAANTATVARTGTVTVAGQTFTVNQVAAPCGAFTISPTSQSSVAASGASLSVTVTGTTNCARTASSNASWITVTAGASGTGSGTVSLAVAANTAGTTRTGTVTIAGQTFTVSQAAAPCGAFSLSPNQSVAAAGGAVTVTVTGTTGCARTATSNASWITVTAGGSGTGSGTVSLTVAANTAGTSRTGTVTIGGQLFSVTQNAAACGAFSLAPTSANLGASGGPVTILVTGTLGCSRTATSNAAWITVTGGASASGSGTASLSVAANTVGTPRTGTVTVGGQTFTVTQAAAACSYGVTPLSQSLASGGGSFTATVTATTGCAWTAVSNAAWITVSGGSSGSGNGSKSLTVAGNTSTSPRSGSVTVGGRVVSVSQAGATPVSVTALTSSVSLPTTAGTAITWTATATGGSSPLLYQFWRYSQSTGAWTMVRDYSTSPSYTWATTSANAGTHALQVWVKATGSTAPRDAYRATGTFSLTGPASLLPPSSGPLAASAPLPSPRVAGTPFTWTITTTGGVAPLQFKFWLYSSATGTWTMVRDYATGNSLTYTPPVAGTYALQAWVRNAGSTASYTVTVATGFFSVQAPSSGSSPAVSGPAPTSVLLTTSQPAPFVGGVAVTLTATPFGTTAPVEHKFWEYANGTWRVLRDYATTPTLSWQPTAGQRALQVWTRRVGSTLAKEVFASSGFVTVLAP